MAPLCQSAAPRPRLHWQVTAFMVHWFTLHLDEAQGQVGEELASHDKDDKNSCAEANGVVRVAVEFIERVARAGRVGQARRRTRLGGQLAVHH